MQTTAYKHLRYSLVLALIVLAGCESAPFKIGIWKDKDIPAEKAEKLRRLNTELFKAIKTDRDDAELLFSKNYLEQKNIKVQFDYVNKLRSENEYVLLEDYYIVNKGLSDDELEPINNTEINYVPLAKEMYIAFFIPKNAQNKLMLTVAYGKFSYGWKAQHMALGYYTQQGKTATECYEMAKKDYANGYLVNAINNITMALNCLSPSRYWKQPNSKEINDFADRIITEANEKITYPIVLRGIKSKPAIFSISSHSREEGVTQYVYYLTKIKLTDRAALEEENQQIKQQLPKIFAGIDKGKKNMLYSAMNQKPVAGESINHVDFEEKIDN